MYDIRLCILCMMCVYVCVFCVCSVCVVCVCLHAHVIVVNIVPVGASVPLAGSKVQPSRQLGSGSALHCWLSGYADVYLLSGIFLYSHCSLLLFAGI